MKKKLHTPIMKQKKITPKIDLLNDILSSLTYQNKRLHNLIEMRGDGEITRDIFKAKKQEIEDRLLAIQNELSQLQPQEEAIDDATHDEKIKSLNSTLNIPLTPTQWRTSPKMLSERSLLRWLFTRIALIGICASVLINRRNHCVSTVRGKRQPKFPPFVHRPSGCNRRNVIRLSKNI